MMSSSIRSTVLIGFSKMGSVFANLDTLMTS